MKMRLESCRIKIFFLLSQIHLTHDDFVSVFKMEYPEFEALPKWRQTQLKKEYKLF
jgi:Villin headpiece domain